MDGYQSIEKLYLCAISVFKFVTKENIVRRNRFFFLLFCSIGRFFHAVKSSETAHIFGFLNFCYLLVRNAALGGHLDDVAVTTKPAALGSVVNRDKLQPGMVDFNDNVINAVGVAHRHNTAREPLTNEPDREST